ncbi:MAG: hypothetical protein KDK91_23255 [Gammaproteobacteria bacterium]|nr:hypothetical protein [Gammaproteobacteria bacterium]
MNRAAAITLSLSVLVFGTVIALGLVDEPLNGEARRWLQPPAPPAPQRNLFLALHGFDAPLDQEPVRFGLSRIQHFDAALQTSRARGEPFEYVDPAVGDAGEQTPLPLCDFTVEYCVGANTVPDELVQSPGERRVVLLERYRALRGLPVSVTVGTPHLLSPLSRISPVLEIQQLELTRIVQLARRGELERVRAALAAEIEFDRRLLTLADSLMLKMLARALLERSLHVYAQLADLGPAMARKLHGIDIVQMPLSATERSMHAALAHEYRFQASIVLDDTLLADVTDLGWAQFAVPLVFKRNATLNLMYATFSAPLQRYEQLDMPQFAERWRSSANRADRARGLDSPLHWLIAWPFNPVGRALMAISGPDLAGFFARVCNVEALRRMAVAKVLIRRDGVADMAIGEYLAALPPELSDPYTRGPLQVDLERRVLRSTWLQRGGQVAQGSSAARSMMHHPYEIALGPR